MSEEKRKRKRRRKRPESLRLKQNKEVIELVKTKSASRLAREKQLIRRTAALVVGVAAILAVIILAILKPFHKEDGIVSDVEEVMEQTSEKPEVDDDAFSISEQEKEAALARIKAVDGLEQAWEDSWLKKIDISGDTCDYLTIEDCVIMQEDTSKVKVEGILEGIPDSDSEDLYLFALNTYENSIPEGSEPADTYRIEKTDPKFVMYANLNHKQASTRLFKKFVVAAKVKGRYQILGTSRYITNPEAIAKVDAYKKTSSVKGLIVDPNKLHGNELDDLGVKQGAYNIPLGYIMGGTSSANKSTIYYDYGGKTYAFNGQAVAEFDIVFGTLQKKGIQATAVILNNSNGAYPELIHPNARSASQSWYYMFNGSDAAGVNAMAAAATFLAERYSGAHGMISNWIIANEINATKEWNHYAAVDHYTYADEYAKGFRVFYNAIKSVNAGAKVYMPLDQTWNRNLNNGDYDGRDILDDFNSIIKTKGNINWDLAYHSYPVPLTNAAFWNTGSFAKYTTQSVDTPMVSMKNVNIVTDYICGSNFLKDDGTTREVFISEVGFTSTSGEAVQAAAIAYAYYICEKNPHINGLIINHETDDGLQLSQGLAVGLSHANGAHKYAYEVYKHLDMADSLDYTKFALDVIGAGSWADLVKYW